jgi:hypothetical protein
MAAAAANLRINVHVHVHVPFRVDDCDAGFTSPPPLRSSHARVPRQHRRA